RIPIVFFPLTNVYPLAKSMAGTAVAQPYLRQPGTAGPTWRKAHEHHWMALFGLVVGAIAKFLMPGRDPGGWIVTILLGIAGSFVGGFLASALMGRQGQTAGWIGSIIGAIVLLFIYRLIGGRRTVV